MTLSELVAVEVMGAKVITTIDPVPDGFYVRNGAVYYGNDAGRNRCEVFMPDTNITDAWRVVEKMREKGWRFALEDNKSYSHMAEFWREPDHPDYKDTDAWQDWQLHGKEPLAICLAALRACGVSEERIEQARKENA